jgi:hypothetical protein
MIGVVLISQVVRNLVSKSEEPPVITFVNGTK